MSDSRKIVDKARVPTRVLRAKPPPITIVDAMNDPDIFGPWFRDRESFAAWFVVLKVIFGLPLDAAELAIFQRHTGRTSPAPGGYFDICLVIGRRGGKSLALATIAAFLSAFVDWTPFLTGGEKATIIVVAADRKTAAVTMGYLRQMLSIPLLSGLIVRETVDVIELSNGAQVEVVTPNFKSIRGRTVVCGIADELAFWEVDEHSASPDVAVIAALEPAMATVPGARLLKASSPYARRGVLWRDYERYYGRDDAKTLVWQAATREMNPAISEDFVRSKYEADPASAEAEYGAQFRSDVQVLFARDAINAVVINGRLELPPQQHAAYFAWTDPSGGSADSMTLAIGHCEGETAILDAVRERRPPFSPEQVVSEFCTLLRSYSVTEIRGDRYGGEWPREQFSKRGITYTVSEKPASQLYLEFLPQLNAGSVELLDHPRLISQLIGLERKTSRAGRDLISHAPNSHDDLANAVSAVLVTAATEDQRFYIADDQPLTPDQNYKLATQAYVQRALTGRSLYWYKLETARRARSLPDRDPRIEELHR